MVSACGQCNAKPLQKIASVYRIVPVIFVAQAARRLVAADESGASVVLSLLRESIASKSIRVTELFNAMDTSKDGLISRQGPVYGTFRLVHCPSLPCSAARFFKRLTLPLHVCFRSDRCLSLCFEAVIFIGNKAQSTRQAIACTRAILAVVPSASTHRRSSLPLLCRFLPA